MQSKDILSAVALAALGLTIPAAGALAGPPASGVAKTAKATVAGPALITGVDVISDEKGTHITITGDRPFTPDVRNYGRPAATVITITGRWGAGKAGVASVARNGVSTVRFGQFAEQPKSLVRIVANTNSFLPFTATPSADRTRWEIVVHAPGVAVGSMNSAPSVAPSSAGLVKPAVQTATQLPIAPAAPKTTTPPAVQAAAPVYATRVASTGSGPFPGMLKMPDQPGAKTEKIVKAAPAPTLPTKPVPIMAHNRTDAPPVGTAPAAVASPDGEERRVSLDFVAADINDVLKALSLQSGINIVTGNDVKGSITVSLKRVSMTEALDMVTRLSGYTYALFGSAYVVGTPASVGSITARSEKTVENVTEFIPYRYMATGNLYRILGDKFPGLKLPEADKNEAVGQRMLVLTDTPKRTAEVREFVDKLEQVASVPTQSGATEVYRVKYAAPTELIVILSRLVPTVSVQLGPTQGFQPNALGGSAAFQSTATPAPQGPSGAPAGGGSAAAPSGGASAGASGGGGGKSVPNLILLTGAPADIARAKDVLNQIDIRVPQIKFEAKVIDIGNSDISDLGFKYDLSRGVQIGENNVTPSNATVGASTAASPARPVNFGTIFRSPYSIGVSLDALAKIDKNRLLANPNLSALDGQPASVFIGDAVKYVISIQQTQQGQVIQTETASVGITLKVTGKASPDGTITLYVHPEVSVITGTLDAGNGISLPQISTRFVDTTVRIKDGETFAIGGLIRQSDISTIQKVPILGDLPFFGNLFKSRHREKADSNLVVFITTTVEKD